MPISQQTPPIDSYDLTATISSGTSTSQAIDLAGNILCGLFMPSAFTGSTIKITAASSLTGTYMTVEANETGGGDYTITATPGKYIPVSNLGILSGLRFISLVSSSNEATTRAIQLAVRPV